MMTDFGNWLKDGSIRSFQPTISQVQDLLSSAQNDLQTARLLRNLERFGHSRDTAYEAMLKTGMALMFHYGFRPSSGSHHLTIVKFAKQALGPNCEDIIIAFDRFRRTRNDRLYRGKEMATKSQANQAINNAKKLLEIVRDKVAKDH